MHDSRKSHLSPSRSGTSSRIRPSRHWPPSSKHGLRGLLLSRDELGGWIASFDQYKARAGSDTANWLSMHRAGPITIDRKTGRRIIHVPRVAVSVTGGIQPEVLPPPR